MEVEEEKVVQKRNNLNTRFIPSILMLVAGLISLIICICNHYSNKGLLLTVFLSMLIFAIIGAVIKGIVDSFDMAASYEDLFEDEGEIHEKGNE